MQSMDHPKVPRPGDGSGPSPTGNQEASPQQPKGSVPAAKGPLQQAREAIAARKQRQRLQQQQTQAGGQDTRQQPVRTATEIRAEQREREMQALLAQSRSGLKERNEEARQVIQEECRKVQRRLAEENAPRKRARACKIEEEVEDEEEIKDEEDIKDEKKARIAARRVLSSRLKDLTKRSALEQVLGCGGLHAWREKTIINHAAMPMPSDYDWTWRQKEFRPQERMGSRIDRMVGRMVGENQEELRKQLKIDREAYIASETERVTKGDRRDSAGAGSTRAFVKKALAGSTPSVGLGLKPTLAWSERRNLGVNDRADSRNLAADIAPFISDHEDPADLLWSFSGYIDESINTKKIVNYLKEQSLDQTDVNHFDVVEIASPERSDDSDSGYDTATDFDVDDERVDTPLSEEPDNMTMRTEYDKEDEVTLEDDLAVEWLNELLMQSARHVFSDAHSRWPANRRPSMEDLAVLCAEVTNDIKREWAVRMFLEDSKAGKKSMALSLAPFEDAFGGSFVPKLMAAVGQYNNGGVAFVKMANAAGLSNRGPSASRPEMGSRRFSGSGSDDDTAYYGSDGDDSAATEVAQSPREQQQELVQATIRQIRDFLLDGTPVDGINRGLLATAFGTRVFERLFTNAFNEAFTLAQEQEPLLRGFQGPPVDQSNERFIPQVLDRLARSDERRLQGPPHGQSSERYIPQISNRLARSYEPQPPQDTRTNPYFWTFPRPDRDHGFVEQVLRDRARDTYGIEEAADRNERQHNWKMANERAQDRIPLPELMEFDIEQVADFRNLTTDLPDEHIEDSEGMPPLDIDPCSSYVMGRLHPSEYNGEAWEYSRVEANVEGRRDAYDGTGIPVPNNSPTRSNVRGDGYLGGGGPRDSGEGSERDSWATQNQGSVIRPDPLDRSNGQRGNYNTLTRYGEEQRLQQATRQYERHASAARKRAEFERQLRDGTFRPPTMMTTEPPRNPSPEDFYRGFRNELFSPPPSRNQRTGRNIRGLMDPTDEQPSDRKRNAVYPATNNSTRFPPSLSTKPAMSKKLTVSLWGDTLAKDTPGDLSSYKPNATRHSLFKEPSTKRDHEAAVLLPVEQSPRKRLRTSFETSQAPDLAPNTENKDDPSYRPAEFHANMKAIRESQEDYVFPSSDPEGISRINRGIRHIFRVVDGPHGDSLNSDELKELEIRRAQLVEAYGHCLPNRPVVFSPDEWNKVTPDLELLHATLQKQRLRLTRRGREMIEIAQSQVEMN